MADSAASAQALLSNPKFVEMFQKAAGDGKMPEDPDKREAWLRELQDKLHQETMQEAVKDIEKPVSDADGEWMWIVPEPGFCVKCHTARKAKKVFINICQHPRIAEPQPLEDASKDDAIQFRIPLSCGAARADTDKKGAGCSVYDVVVNPDTIKRCGEDNEFRRFVAALCMTWIKQKSEPELNAEEFTNINVKAKGKPGMQRIRLGAPKASSNAMGDEIKLPESNASGSVPAPSTARPSGAKLVMEVDPTPEPEAATPKESYELQRHGAYDWGRHAHPARNTYFRDDVPSTVDVMVHLPDVATIKEVDVQISGRKLQFVYVDSDDGEPFYTIHLPWPVATDPEAARFVRKQKKLQLTLRVALPDEEEEAKQRGAAHECAVAEEERAAAQGRRQQEEALRAQQAKLERMEAEERSVMAERKALADGLAAMQSGDVPPDLKQEIDAMEPEQARAMMLRLEGKVRRGDGVDQLLDKLPDTVLYAITSHIRGKLGLAALPPPAEAAAVVEAPASSTPSQPTDTVEYDFAKKAELLFGVKMYNRYVFALEH